MESKPLIDYAKVPNKRRSIDLEATKAFRAILAWSLVFGGFMIVLAMAGNAGYFN
jgi:hypothetical protein